MRRFFNTPTISTAILCFSVVLAGPADTASAQGKQRGATLGGLAGAVAGGIIGDNNNEAGAGAAIGGVIGAVAGGILGDANDKQRAAQQQQYYYQQQQQQTQRVVQTMSAVSISDVVNMSRSGLSDSVIINQINQRGVRQELQVPDIITLHQQGVREHVITAMQQARVGGQAVAAPGPPPVVVQQPTVIHETHVLPAYPVRRYYYPAPAHRYHRSHGTAIHFGF